MELLKDKICLVTGGAKGIGKAIVDYFIMKESKLYSVILIKKEDRITSELPGSEFIVLM